MWRVFDRIAGGGRSDDGLYRNRCRETIIGSAGEDRIIGRGGNDTLTGGGGNDVFAYDTRHFDFDTITDFNTNGDRIDLSYLHIADLASLQSLMIQAGNDIVIALGWTELGGTAGLRLQNVALSSLSDADFIFNTSTNPLTVTGTAGMDILFGGAGDDRIIGGADSDWLVGGAGNDVFVYGSREFGRDTIADFNTSGDRIDLSHLHLGDFASLQPFMTQDGADVVIAFKYGVYNDEVIRIENVALGSLSAADFIFDTSTSSLNVTGTPYGDVLFGGNGDDTISGGGSDGWDRLVGGAGNDRLIGGGGQDWLMGGAGHDVFIFNQRAFDDDTIADFDANGDRIDLSALNVADIDSLRPLMSQDGNDVVIALGYGFDESIRLLNVSLDSLSNADFVFNTSTSPLTVTGTFYRDVLFGGAGNDTISGNEGFDTLVGGAGNDIFAYKAREFDTDTIVDFNTNGDRIDLSALHVTDIGRLLPFMTQDGNDVVITLGYNSDSETIRIKNVALGSLSNANFIFDTSTNALTVIGTAYKDVLFGGAGNDTISADDGDRVDGGAGDDTIVSFGGAARLDGGSGIDTVSYAPAWSSVTVDLSAGKGTEGDVLVGIENITGGHGNDTLIGNAGANVLQGQDGDDLLRGGAGADRLDGGAGIDTAGYDFASTGVTVDLSTGKGTAGEALGDILVGIENLVGGQGNDTLTGDAGANVLQGGNGDDVMRGGAGADRLDGGNSTDTASYFTSNIGVIVNLAAGTASGGDAQGDVLISIENLSGSQGSDQLTGDAWANTLQGWNGNDTLRGGAGTDVLDGGAGTDTASYVESSAGISVSLVTGKGAGGEAQGDTLTGIENLSGGLGNDGLEGNAGNNVLQGWGGNDALVGGAGKDTLTGGTGADRFYFMAVTDSVVGANADRITDFNRAEGDRIDLHLMDANTTVAGDQAFTFIGTGLYTGVAGQLRYAIVDGVTTIAGDINGDKVSDFHIQLTGTISLMVSDIVL
ncbi:M10 family metallopeptidase C-terminal domain-containing protein [Inquilinus limosus]|uniref:calcium-binding protein n=1 Tax=Inquilinus limosus TaxID=171674 RepID=UPI003F15F959